MTWLPIDESAVRDHKEISRNLFGYPVVSDLNDLDVRAKVQGKTLADVRTRTGALETQAKTLLDKIRDNVTVIGYLNAAVGLPWEGDTAKNRIAALEKRMDKFVRYLSSDNSDHGVDNVPIAKWAAVGGKTIDEVSVDDKGIFTVAEGWWEFSAGWHATYKMPELNLGFNSNAYIADPTPPEQGGPKYAACQQQDYYVQYPDPAHPDVLQTLEASGTLGSGIIQVTSAKRKWAFVLAAAQKITLDGTLDRIFISFRKVSA